MLETIRKNEIMRLKSQLNTIIVEKPKLLEDEKQLTSLIIERVAKRTLKALNSIRKDSFEGNEPNNPILQYSFILKENLKAYRVMTDEELNLRNNERMDFDKELLKKKYDYYTSLVLVADSEIVVKGTADKTLEKIKGFVPCVLFWLKDVSVHHGTKLQSEPFDFSIEFTMLDCRVFGDLLNTPDSGMNKLFPSMIRYYEAQEFNWVDLLLLGDEKFKQTIGDIYNRFVNHLVVDEGPDDNIKSFIEIFRK